MVSRSTSDTADASDTSLGPHRSFLDPADRAFRILFPSTVAEPEFESPDDIAHAYRRARDVLAAWRGDALPRALRASPTVRSLQARARTQVLLVSAASGGERFVLKLHRDPESYFQERFALELFGDTEDSLSARLVATDESAQALLIEHVAETVELRSDAEFAEACQFLGTVHGHLRQFADVLTDDLGFPCFADFCQSDQVVMATRAQRPERLRAACERVMALFGPDDVPCCISDLKMGHLRRRPDRSMALIDLENLSGRLPQTIDLLGMLNLVAREPWLCPVTAEAWLGGCAAYLRGAGRSGTPGEAEARAEALMEAVHWTAAAFEQEAMLPGVLR